MKIVPPNRVARSYTQQLTGTPDQVFPLLCPVREAEWIAGWDPVLVLTESGVAEPGCVFTTRDERGEAVWCITRHDPETRQVEMLKVTPNVTLTRLIIAVSTAEEGSRAEITYEQTSLGPDGDTVVADFTQEYFNGFMELWERRMNHFLRTGSILQS